MKKASEVVVSDPEIRGGDPVIRGTRTPVYDLVANSYRCSMAELLAMYPAVTEVEVEAAQIWVKANPRPDQSKLRPALPDGVQMIQSYTVRRRGK